MLIKISGDWACFTAPEFKVERFSYSVITPEAAENIIKSVFWKPEIDYEVKKIYIIKEGTYVSIGATKESVNKNGLSKYKPTLRSNMFLKNVEYVLDIKQIVYADKVKPTKANIVKKYEEMLRKRLSKGKYFRTPYLGLAGCPCKEIKEVSEKEVIPKKYNKIIPGMVLRRKYNENKNESHTIFFDAKIINGVMEVPSC